MADDFPRDRPHLQLRETGEAEPYRRPNQAIEPRPLPLRDRALHAAMLHGVIGAAVAAARDRLAHPDAAVQAEVPGFYLSVEFPAAERAAIDLLANRPKKIEVVSVQEPSRPNAPLVASVFVPAAAQDYYSRKVDDYRDINTHGGRPRNEPLVSRMNTVYLATSRSLFTDDEQLFPQPADRQVWWEVWLREGRRQLFDQVAQALNIAVKPHAVRFPEREVVIALASSAALDRVVAHSDVVAELRRAKDTPALFMGLGGAEQREWVADVVGRLRAPTANVAVCLLDSGVRRAHPLIAPALDDADWHTINQAWGRDDTPAWRGHGTRMAGVALYGDLVSALIGEDDIELAHHLESVRILPPDEADANDPELYGAITNEAVARVEIQAPDRRRAIAMAVSSTATTRGRPSSWSAAIDQLCYESDARRLIFLSAGNIRDDVMAVDYPARNDLEQLDDPGQSWNALTVGAYTEKVDIIDNEFQGYLPMANAGGLSPRSCTSVSWDRQWPVKPDIVFEGGNLAHNGAAAGEDIDDLQLLTTFCRPEIRHFTTFGDTSAATALAAKMAGEILAAHPAMWPEMVRAMIVHSAEWTPAMQAEIDACHGAKNQIQALVRRYGYGVPNLQRALLSTRNDLTLLVEDQLRPFHRVTGTAVKTRDMMLHKLPWPREQLADLGAAEVTLRVTLSYYIEPNPGERGWTRRHRYASHGLRFRMKSATEDIDEFRARINQAARDEEEGAPAAGGESWVLGTFRDSGSIHSDFWSGPAAELAERDAIGIFPVGGWWKEKPYLERFNQAARYALVVTIRAPGQNVDIYTPVETQVAIANLVPA